MKHAIYPSILITNTQESFIVDTWLRKQHTDGVWWLQHFYKSVKYQERYGYTMRNQSINNRESHLNMELERLHRQVYQAIITGFILPKEEWFKKDENQESESDRLKELFL